MSASVHIRPVVDTIHAIRSLHSIDSTGFDFRNTVDTQLLRKSFRKCLPGRSSANFPELLRTWNRSHFTVGKERYAGRSSESPLQPSYAIKARG